jgi:hypothetical protein
MGCSSDSHLMKIHTTLKHTSANFSSNRQSFALQEEGPWTVVLRHIVVVFHWRHERAQSGVAADNSMMKCTVDLTNPGA